MGTIISFAYFFLEHVGELRINILRRNISFSYDTTLCRTPAYSRKENFIRVAFFVVFTFYHTLRQVSSTFIKSVQHSS
jgi:hypothetical protein